MEPVNSITVRAVRARMARLGFPDALGGVGYWRHPMEFLCSSVIAFDFRVYDHPHLTFIRINMA
jgi:hypothetical protein